MCVCLHAYIYIHTALSMRVCAGALVPVNNPYASTAPKKHVHVTELYRRTHAMLVFACLAMADLGVSFQGLATADLHSLPKSYVLYVPSELYKRASHFLCLSLLLEEQHPRSPQPVVVVDCTLASAACPIPWEQIGILTCCRRTKTKALMLSAGGLAAHNPYIHMDTEDSAQPGCRSSILCLGARSNH